MVKEFRPRGKTASKEEKSLLITVQLGDGFWGIHYIILATFVGFMIKKLKKINILFNLGFFMIISKSMNSKLTWGSFTSLKH